MATYYINDNTGNDSNDGSLATPWKTLFKAINSGGAGAVLIFFPGIYEDDAPSGTSAGQTFIGRGNVVFRNSHPTFRYETSATTLDFYNINFITTQPLFHSAGTTVTMHNCGISTVYPVLGYGTICPSYLTNCTFLCNSFAGFTPYPTVLRCATSGTVIGNTVVTPNAFMYSYSGCSLPLPPSYSTTMFPCAAWVNDSSYSSGLAQINANDIQLASGSTSARVLSPVLDYGSNMVFRSFGVLADEITDNPGSNAVIDSTPATTARTLDYRSSTTTFASGAASPSWVEYTRGTGIVASGQYLQYRVTLIQNGA